MAVVQGSRPSTRPSSCSCRSSSQRFAGTLISNGPSRRSTAQSLPPDVRRRGRGGVGRTGHGASRADGDVLRRRQPGRVDPGRPEPGHCTRPRARSSSGSTAAATCPPDYVARMVERARGSRRSGPSGARPLVIDRGLLGSAYAVAFNSPLLGPEPLPLQPHVGPPPTRPTSAPGGARPWSPSAGSTSGCPATRTTTWPSASRAAASRSATTPTPSSATWPDDRCSGHPPPPPLVRLVADGPTAARAARAWPPATSRWSACAAVAASARRSARCSGRARDRGRWRPASPPTPALPLGAWRTASAGCAAARPDLDLDAAAPGRRRSSAPVLADRHRRGVGRSGWCGDGARRATRAGRCRRWGQIPSGLSTRSIRSSHRSRTAGHADRSASGTTAVDREDAKLAVEHQLGDGIGHGLRVGCAAPASPSHGRGAGRGSLRPRSPRRGGRRRPPRARSPGCCRPGWCSGRCRARRTAGPCAAGSRNPAKVTASADTEVPGQRPGRLQHARRRDPAIVRVASVNRRRRTARVRTASSGS